MDRVAIGLVGGVLLAAIAWRFVSRRHLVPCPAWMAWLLESRIAKPLMDADRTLAPLQLARGMSVLDAGCGAGRVTLRLADEVGWEGGVLAVDVQPKMLKKVEERAMQKGVHHIQTRCIRLGMGELPRDQFDRAVLATVLGEIPDQVAALREIRGALKPGGLLAVTEVFPDPHYQTRRHVKRVLEEAGFDVVAQGGGFLSHTTLARRRAE